MYIEISKKEFLDLAKLRPFYIYGNDAILVESLISYQLSTHIKNNPNSKFSMDLKNNLALKSISNLLDYSDTSIDDLLSKLRSHYGHNSSRYEKARQQVVFCSNNKHNKDDSAIRFLEEGIYPLSETICLNVPFAKTLKDLKEFVKEKEYFYFNHKTSQIETSVVAAEIDYKFINYNDKKTIVDLSFKLNAFDREWTLNDLIFFEDKKCFKDLFVSYDELIDFKIKESESNLNYFNSLKKSSKPNDYRISNAVKY